MPDAVTPVMAADATWRADPCVAPCVVHVFVALLFMVLWSCGPVVLWFCAVGGAGYGAMVGMAVVETNVPGRAFPIR
ncbi:hypothetical protein [Novacetimonas hansenii]|uniref:hypothetical protein n=1 Tax=Novacetimonas hansenii TaxID=436 RepID=UPI0011C0F49A|nr:hypothetical protein [Novacetimonas hansenii]WEQ58444.1 hypothetical protein LV563_11415 [Novacetimonas hansenii]